MKRIIRRVIEQLGYDIYRVDPNQPGKDPLRDIGRYLRHDRPIIFDVGAHHGESTRLFRQAFPGSTIYSFEPSPASFEILRTQMAQRDTGHLRNYALGSSSRPMTFLENSRSDMSSFLPLGEFGWGKIAKETVVDVKTVDQVCADEHITQIDVLKSDTQGFDLEVFKGASNMIQAGKIGLIYFEIIFSDMYENLPSFGETYDFLTKRNYRLVSFYQFYYQKQVASWTDALFVHRSRTSDGA